MKRPDMQLQQSPEDVRRFWKTCSVRRCSHGRRSSSEHQPRHQPADAEPASGVRPDSAPGRPVSKHSASATAWLKARPSPSPVIASTVPEASPIRATLPRHTRLNLRLPVSAPLSAETVSAPRSRALQLRQRLQRLPRSAARDHAKREPRKPARGLPRWHTPDSVRPSTLPCGRSRVRRGNAAGTHNEARSRDGIEARPAPDARVGAVGADNPARADHAICRDELLRQKCP